FLVHPIPWHGASRSGVGQGSTHSGPRTFAVTFGSAWGARVRSGLEDPVSRKAARLHAGQHYLPAAVEGDHGVGAGLADVEADARVDLHPVTLGEAEVCDSLEAARQAVEDVGAAPSGHGVLTTVAGDPVRPGPADDHVV